MAIAPPSQRFRLLLVVAIAVASAAVAGFVLTAVLGPTDNGLRCSRSAAGARCEILRTRFFGLAGNSAFTIPEAAIRGVRTECGRKGAGRGSSSCNVSLILASTPDSSEPVLSYVLRSQAEAATRKLSGYLSDSTARSIALDEDVLTPAWIFGLLPILAVVLGIGVMRIRSRR